MFESDVPEVRQFLAGDTKGPIGMAEEKDEEAGTSEDEGRQEDRPSKETVEARSTVGMTYQETAEMERASGAPDDRRPPPAPPPAPTDEDWRRARQARDEEGAPATEGPMFEGWGDEAPGRGKR
jgi:hypothetical protein